MAARGENAGFHFLDEIVCVAISGPGVLPPGATPSVGVNGGMRILDEIVVDLSRQAAPTTDLTGPQRTALRLVADGKSLDHVAQTLGVSAPEARDVLLAAVETLRSRLAG